MLCLDNREIDPVDTVALNHEDVDTLADSRLGEFQLLRVVGRGGMGVVYEARQESLDRSVAIKVMAAGPLSKNEFLDRFRREAQAAGRLHHTNIVPVYGVGEDRGIHYFAMQFIAGRGLDRLLAEQRKERTKSRSLVDFRWAARIIADAAGAVDYAHRQGIVHRDIKPANLLLDEQDTIWITDFGLARLDDVDDLTATGDVVGTTRFMAPERFAGNSSPAADIYSLGVTLYELLTLRPAFDASDRVSLVGQIRKTEPARPQSIESGIPRDLETIVLKAMAKEPAKRYAAAGELALDLRNFLAGAPISARRASMWERSVRWARRHPIEAGLSAAFILTTAGGIAASTTMYLRSEQHRMQAVENLNAAQSATELADGRLIEVERERLRAEGNLKQALDAVDEYLTKTSDSKLLQVAGAQPLRRELLESALKFYRGFLERQTNSPTLQTEVASAHVHCAAIVGGIGRTDDAAAENSKAIEILRPLVANDWTPKRANMLATALAQVGLSFAKLGNLEKGKPFIEESIHLFEQIVERDPQNEIVAHNIAKAHTNMCVALWQRRERVQSTEHCRKALAILEKLAAKSPANFEYTRSIGSNYQNLSVLATAGGMQEQAVEYATRAHERFDAVLKLNPNEPRARYQVAKMLFRLCDLQALFSPAKLTLARLDKAQSIYEKLVAENPAVADFRAGLMECSSLRAMVYKIALRPAEAVPHVERAVALCREAVARDPKNHSIQSQALNGELTYAMVLIAAGRHSEASLVLESSAARIASFKTSFTPETEIYTALTKVELYRAEILKSQKRDDEAKAKIAKVIDRTRKSLASTAENDGLRGELCQAWLLAGKIERSRGQFGPALEALAEAKAAAGIHVGNSVECAKLASTLADAAPKFATGNFREVANKLRQDSLQLLRSAAEHDFGIAEAFNDKDLDGVRQTPEFKKIFAGLSKIRSDD